MRTFMILLASIGFLKAQSYPNIDTIWVEIEPYTYLTDKLVIIDDNDEPNIMYHGGSDASFIEDRRIAYAMGDTLIEIDYTKHVFMSISDTIQLEFMKGMASQQETQYTIHKGTTLGYFNLRLFNILGELVGLSMFRQII